MRLLKLGIRSVLEWRRSVSPAVAAVVLVSALVTMAGSIHVPITVAAHRYYRLGLGEYAGRMTPEAADRLAVAATELNALVSVATIPTAGVLDSVSDLLLVRTSSTDLAAELVFRGLSASLSAESRESLAPGDAVLLAGGPTTKELRGRVARLSTSGQPLLARVVSTGPTTVEGPQLLVHEPAPRGPLLVRVRGAAAALEAAALRAAGIEVDAGDATEGSAAGPLAEGSLGATDWHRRASARIASLARATRTLVLVLAALAFVTLVPGQLLLLERAEPTFRVLLAWGFTPRDRGVLIVTMGAFAALVASVAGAAIGLAVASIMNARETGAINFLPLDLAYSLRAVTDVVAAPVTPAVGWAGGCALAATLLGALTALPSARVAATLDSRRDRWHY